MKGQFPRPAFLLLGAGDRTGPVDSIVTSTRRPAGILRFASLIAILVLALLLAFAGPARAQGLQGSSVLALDGSDDYATGPDGPAYDIGTGANDDFTLETMFHVVDVTAAQTGTLFYKNGAYGVYILFNVSGDQDRIIYKLWTDPVDYVYLYYNVTLSDGWHHLACVFDNEYTDSTDLTEIYLDGSLVCTGPVADWTPGLPDSSGALCVGGYFGINSFPGWLEETRISSCVRYSGDTYDVPTMPFSTDPNTLALWHFDEAPGTTSFLDSSGGDNSLTGVNGAATFNEDTTAPSGTMQIAGGAAYASSTSVTLDSSVSDANPVQMRFRDAGGAWSSWEAYADTHSWTLPAGDGAKTVEAEYRDVAGNVLALSDDIILDTTAPSGTMQIDSGATYTNTTDVTVGNSVSGASEMRFKTYNGSSWVYTPWTSYAATASVTLSAPDGTKKVYGYYRDAAGNLFSTLDTIVLDTTPPSGSMQLNKGALATNQLSVTANSSVTGATQMRFKTYNGSSWVYTPWTSYAAKATVAIAAPDGSKRVYAYYRDAAGNLFSTSDTIVLDSTPPSGTMQLNKGATTTSSTTVTADSAVKGATQMRFKVYNGSSWVYTAWVPYASKATVTLYAPAGTKWVYAYYRDAAGNSLMLKDSIVLSMR
jgi:hypothetical protein